MWVSSYPELTVREVEEIYDYVIVGEFCNRECRCSELA